MSTFKDSVGRWITTGLFKETATSDNFVVYSLEEAKQLYIDSGDPTGYLFAVEHLGGWQHWMALKNSRPLQPILAAWEEELEVKLRSENLREVIKHAKSARGYQAAKYLTEGGWKPKEKGRPTKEKISREARVRSKMYDEFRPTLLELKKK